MLDLTSYLTGEDILVSCKHIVALYPLTEGRGTCIETVNDRHTNDSQGIRVSETIAEISRRNAWLGNQ